MNNDLLSHLAELDAAPRTEISAADLDRQDQLLRTVLSDSEPPGRSVLAASRRPPVRRVTFPLACALAAGVVLVVVTSGSPTQHGQRDHGNSGPLSKAEVATWTSTASSPDAVFRQRSSAFVWCLRETKKASGDGGPGTVVTADARGTSPP